MTDHERMEMSDERDLLVSRIIDGEATGEHWTRFREIAEQDQSIWAELAEAQSQQESLVLAVESAVMVAETVDTPELYADTAVFQRRLDVLSRWGGWAAAAAIVLVWFTGLPTASSSQPVNTAGLTPMLGGMSPDEALDQYIESGQTQGRVLSTMPDQIVEISQNPDGTFEVVYLRQLLERRNVGSISRPSYDEFGNVVPRPVEVIAPSPSRSRSY